MVPILRPPHSVPSEWAASSITGTPRASASAMMASMSEVWPRMWLISTAAIVIVELGREIGEVDAEVLAHLDQHRHAVGVDHGRGHGGEGEGGDQDPRAFGQVERLERQKQRRRAG